MGFWESANDYLWGDALDVIWKGRRWNGVVALLGGIVCLSVAGASLTLGFGVLWTMYTYPEVWLCVGLGTLTGAVGYLLWPKKVEGE